MLDPKIKRLAKGVRKACEKLAFSKQALPFDFYREKDLTCMCAVASKFLFDCLKDNSFKPILVAGHWNKLDGDLETNHCWIEVDNHLIDLTATQINIKEKVVILPLQKTKRAYTLKNKMRTLKEIKNEFKGWSDAQSPLALKFSYKDFL